MGKKIIMMLIVLALSVPVFAQETAELPAQWTCYIEGDDAERQVCEGLNHYLLRDGWIKEKGPRDPMWWVIDAYAHRAPETNAVAVTFQVMLAYPAKTGRMLIAVTTYNTAIPQKGVANGELYEQIVQTAQLDVASWARAIGPFIEAMPLFGREWYERQQ